MQAATMTGDMVLAPELTMAPGEQTRQWVGRAVRIAFFVVGVAATAWIMGEMGVLMAYGLPAPLIRRVPVYQPA